MRDDFCAIIVTHGRPDRVYTLESLRKHGYTGNVLLLVDDEDETYDEYVKRHGADVVVQFSKEAAAEVTDTGDNRPDRRSVLFARNAIFDVAREAGYEHFIMLDDDYTSWWYRFDAERRYGNWKIGDLDTLFEGLVEFLEETPFTCVAISQGGDHIGGGHAKTTVGFSRKVMNTFVCSVSKHFSFYGRLNDDVNTYTLLSREGVLFLTFMAAQVNQLQTQSNAGGLTELYLDFGTYVKSFSTVMFAPSCAVVAPLRGNTRNAAGIEPGHRIHHRIYWNRAAPKIIPERFKKAPR